MREYAASLALVALVLSTVACNGDGGTVVNPTPLATAGGSTNVSIHPSRITAQPVSQPSCPAIPPFVGSLNVNIQAPEFPLSLSRVQLTFTDGIGSAPAVTLPAPVLTRQFGSTLIEARSQRTFPFRFPFGCGTRRTGTLVVVVVIADGSGRESIRELRVPVQ